MQFSFGNYLQELFPAGSCTITNYYFKFSNDSADMFHVQVP